MGDLHKCTNCDNMVDEKYIMCLSCLNKIKEANQKYGGIRQPTPQTTSAGSGDNKDITNKLDQLNNNLYAIRTLLNAQLEETTGKILSWDVESKSFKILESPNILRSQNFVLWTMMEELLKEKGKIIGWNNLEKKFEIKLIGKTKKG